MAKTADGKYYNKSLRWQDCNYGNNGAYFITINTYQRKKFSGQVKNGKILLSEIGKIARDEWLRTASIRPELNLYLNDFVIMPNHFHGIIVIRCKCARTTFAGADLTHPAGADLTHPAGADLQIRAAGFRRAHSPHLLSQTHAVRFQIRAMLRWTKPGASTGSFSLTKGKKFGPQRNNIPSIIRGFKSAVTIRARKIDPSFKWQRSYYDHVIRNPLEYRLIKNYILENPLKYNC